MDRWIQSPHRLAADFRFGVKGLGNVPNVPGFCVKHIRELEATRCLAACETQFLTFGATVVPINLDRHAGQLTASEFAEREANLCFCPTHLAFIEAAKPAKRVVFGVILKTAMRFTTDYTDATDEED